MKALRILSPSARRALVLCGLLAVASACASVGQAWALAAAITGQAALGWLALAVIACGLLTWATQVVAARAAAGAKAELRAVLLDRTLRAGPEWITARGPGELTALATRGLDALDAYFGTFLPALVAAAVTPLGVGAVILFVDWPSAVVVAMTVPLIPLFAILIGRYTEDRVAGAAAANERLSGHLLELVRVLPVLAAFGRARAQAEAVRRTSDAHRRGTLGVLRVAFTSALALELIATLSVALVAVVIGLRLVSGDLSLVVGLFVLIVVPECYLPLRAAGAAHHAAADGMEAVRRVAEVPLTPPAGGRAVSDFAELRIDDLSVRRRDGFAPDGVSLVVKPGEIVRLDSPSGSGKSTLLAVLLGFVAPTSGDVLVDGVPLGELDVEAWRELVAWVPQRPTFAESVVADEVGDRALARDLAAEHLLDRRIDDLSAGERQRVALLRALARPGVRLLLLDEPTAHLDPATAAQVMSVVRRVADSGVAVVLATHRGVDPAVSTTDSASVVEVVAVAEGNVSPLRTLLTRRTLAGAALGAAAVVCGIALTALSAWLIARAAQQPPILALSVAVVGVRTFGLARAGLRYVERLVTHDAAFRTATAARVRLWSALVARGPARLPRGDEGQRRLVDDVDQVRDLTPRVLVPPVIVFAVVAAAVAVQTAILPVAGLVLAAAVVVACVGGPAVTLVAERRATARLAEGRRGLAAQVLTLLDGAADLVAFGRDKRLRTALTRVDARLTARARGQAYGAGAGSALITVALGLASAVSLGLAGGLPSVLVPVVALVPLALADAVLLLPPALSHLAPLRAAHRRTTLPVEPPRPIAVTADGGCGVTGDVRWGGADRPALRGVDLDLPAGARVAVVGPSGSGKSTLVAALLGFLEPERGHASRPPTVAWCPQDPMLIASTVRENLRLAAPEATDADLVAVLREVCLPDLLDAQAKTLSGGEAQRVSLARALLADADLLLLDEPTAHLDRATAERVLAVIHQVRGTVVHVTHFQAEADMADVVVEVADGRVRTRVAA
ncbi:Transport ATP-binding protein CydCD [Alloactinosynnema sp. L-07]|uniref:thiol reductant ABC exporter subunit CydC n=1 Tax=Alloactinosynnema sp. L-07 TaxID=1653480 RepID=UPI00065F01C3|nr:thiol reductant ABC exporter subunit CydC [Alloactinosynnema sp. L-07]CRK60846.1 Transport ATP-binding protein CydCD [Alloactinosynnema sp. L-07]